MDLAAVYSRLLTIKDEELKLFETHLYNVLGISFDHFMFDYDHYTSGKPSNCTRSDKVKPAPTSQIKILDITRFLFNNEDNNNFTRDENVCEQDVVMNTDSGDVYTTDLSQPSAQASNLDLDIHSLFQELPENHSQQPMSEDDAEPAQSESTRGAACLEITAEEARQQEKRNKVIEEPVYVNAVTNNFSTMVINSIVNTAYVAKDPYFNCYESDARKHKFTAPTTPKPCSGELTHVETDLRRRLERFRQCGSGLDNAIAEHFISHAIFHENLVNYPYLNVPPDVGTIFDVADRLQAADAQTKKKRKAVDKGTKKKSTSLKKLKSAELEHKTVPKDGSTEHPSRTQAMALTCVLPSDGSRDLVPAKSDPR